jgi:hypothetical protein
VAVSEEVWRPPAGMNVEIDMWHAVIAPKHLKKKKKKKQSLAAENSAVLLARRTSGSLHQQRSG